MSCCEAVCFLQPFERIPMLRSPAPAVVGKSRSRPTQIRHHRRFQGPAVLTGLIGICALRRAMQCAQMKRRTPPRVMTHLP